MAGSRCIACGCSFRPRPQVPEQSYCSDAACQRERRKLWQREKRREDPAYRENQQRAHHDWIDRNQDYWRRYRESHPEYAERNRQQQKERRTASRQVGVAKMDEPLPDSSFPAGTYRLIPLDGNAAKVDAWIVRIKPLRPA